MVYLRAAVGFGAKYRKKAVTISQLLQNKFILPNSLVDFYFFL